MAEKPVKEPFYNNRWLWIIAVTIVVAIVAVNSEESNENNQSYEETPTNQTAVAPVAQNTTNEPVSKEYKIGDTIQLGDNVLTVNEVSKSQGNDFDRPKSGMEYVIVKVTIENAGTKNIRYSPFDFKVANSQGQITDRAFTTIDSDTSLESGELAPGGKVSGTIAFEQPKDDEKLQLQFEPNFWSKDMIIVNLQ